MSRKPEQDQIELYLDAVSSYLRAMPTDEASAALEEMRSHLRAAISELVANGTEEEQAIADVLNRFGSAKTVGQAIAKASLNAWLTEVDKREGIFVARSLRAALYFAMFGPQAIAMSLMLTPHFYIPAWRLVVAFFLGLIGGSLEDGVKRLARRRLPSQARMNELSAEYATLARSFGLEPSGGNPVSSISWFGSNDTRTVKIVLDIVFIVFSGVFTAWALYTDCRPFGLIGAYWVGQHIAYLMAHLQTRPNGGTKRVKN